MGSMTTRFQRMRWFGDLYLASMQRSCLLLLIRTALRLAI
jgi:hypothetical protein